MLPIITFKYWTPLCYAVSFTILHKFNEHHTFGSLYCRCNTYIKPDNTG